MASTRRFSVMPQNVNEQIQYNAGVLVTDFDITTWELDRSKILGATSGGVSFTGTPEYADGTEGIDNAFGKFLENQELDSWATVQLSGTMVSADTELAKRLIGPADLETDEHGNRVYTPRNSVEGEDFKPIWWVGDYRKKDGSVTGGMAIVIYHALSTNGINFQSQDKNKGQYSFQFDGYATAADPDAPIFRVYYKDVIEEEPTPTVEYTVTNTLTNVTNSNNATKVNAGEAYSATLTADTGYTLGTVEVTMGGTDITSTAYDAGTITIASVTGNLVITATATED